MEDNNGMITKIEQKKNKRKIYKMSPTKNPPNIADSADIISLLYCEEDDIVENLRLRHKKQEIYTAICDILLAVNPYQLLQFMMKH